MPSTATITAFYTFAANTKARATQVNTNFGVFRGHSLPLDPNTATAINNTYDLGSTDYRWKTGYINNVVSASISSTYITASTISAGVIDATLVKAVTMSISGFAYGSFIGGTTDNKITSDGVFADRLNLTYTNLSGGTSYSLTSSFVITKINTGINSNTTYYFTGDNNGQIKIIQRNDSINGSYIQAISTSTTDYIYGANQAVLYVRNADDYLKIFSSDQTKWHNFSASGSWTANVTYTGQYRKIGDSIDFNILIACTGSQTNTALTVNIPFSSKWSIDTAKLLTTTNPLLGLVHVYDSGTYYSGVAMYNSTLTVGIFANNAASTYISHAAVTNTVPVTFAASDYVYISIRGLPITNFF